MSNASGVFVESSTLLGSGPVVIYFYTKGKAHACSVEARAFRDNYGAFVEAGAKIVGISSEPDSTHTEFARRESLPFMLLSDPGSHVRKRFGVPATLGILPGRVTYISDYNGVVRGIFNSQFRFSRHALEALRYVRNLDRR